MCKLSMIKLFTEVSSKCEIENSKNRGRKNIHWFRLNSHKFVTLHIRYLCMYDAKMQWKRVNRIIKRARNLKSDRNLLNLLNCSFEVVQGLATFKMIFCNFFTYFLCIKIYCANFKLCRLLLDFLGIFCPFVCILNFIKIQGRIFYFKISKNSFFCIASCEQ